MPITTSAKKALRGSRRKRDMNLRQKKVITETVKKFRKLVVAKDAKGAQAYFATLQKVLDKATKTGIFKANAVSRKKSRFVAMIKKIA